MQTNSRTKQLIDTITSKKFKDEVIEDIPEALSRLLPISPPPPVELSDLCELLTLVCNRALTDRKFLNNLKTDPNNAIAQVLRLHYPVSGVTFHIHENRPGEVHLVIPLDPRSIPEMHRRSTYSFERVNGIESISVPNDFEGE